MLAKPAPNNNRLFLALMAILLLGSAYWIELKGLPTMFTSPDKELSRSIEKLNAYETMYMEFNMDGTTRVTQHNTGLTQKIDFIVKGYISGMTQGDLSSSTLEISSPLNPTGSIVVNILTTEKYSYLRGPATGGQWLRMTKEEFEKEDESSPADGSFYPFFMLGSVLSEDNALLNAIDKKSIKMLREDEDSRVYFVDISVPEYLESMKADKENTKKDMKDAELILANAVVTAEIHVNKKTKDVMSIDLTTKHLNQIQTAETEEYNIDSVHDAVTHAEFSRLGLPLDIKEPTDYVDEGTQGKDTDEVLGASMKRILKN